MRDDPRLLQERLARFVSAVPAKTLAERIGCDVRTAENIRRGAWPIARHWIGLVATFGRDVVDAVFIPDAAAVRIEQEVQELEARLAHRRATLRLVAGSSRSFAPRLEEAASRGRSRS